MCADQARCVDIHFCCEANLFPDCAEGSEEKTATLQVRLRVLWCVEAGIVERLQGWRGMVGGAEVCGRGGGVWWEGCRYEGGVWSEGWRSVVGGVEGCGRTVTSYSGPTRVPVRDLRRPGFLSVWRRPR